MHRDPHADAPAADPPSLPAGLRAAMLDALGQAVIATDAEGRVNYVNAAAERRYGWSAEALVGRDLVDVATFGAHKQPADVIMGPLRAGKVWEGAWEVRGGDGRTVEAAVTLTPVHDASGTLVAIVGVSGDATPHMAAERRAHHRAKMHEALAELGIHGIRSADLDALVGEATRLLTSVLDIELAKILEYRPDQETLFLRAGVGWRPGLVGHLEMDAKADESLAAYALSRSAPIVVEDLRRDDRFGGPRLLRDHGVVSGISVLIHGPRGPWGVLGVHTRRRRTFSSDEVHFAQSVANVLAAAIDRHDAANALARSEERFRSLAHATRDAIYEVDVPARRVWRNENFVTLTGRPAEAELPDLAALADGVHPDDHARVVRAFAAAVGGRPGLFSEEYRLRRADGSFTDVLDRAFVERDGDGNAVRVLGVLVDISELKEAMRELATLRRSLAEGEKLAAMGQLVSGVAHEIRTPLTAMNNHAHLALSHLDRAAAVSDARDRAFAGRLRPFVTGVIENVDRMNALVEELRRFTRRETGRRSRISLHGPVSDAIQLFIATQAEHVNLSTELRETPPRPLDALRIQQVVLNLMENARDAVASRGAIRVTTRPTPDGGSLLEVEDEGPGIAPDDVPRLFVPLFTTKPTGTGLGLAIVKRIVDDHGGEITVNSSPVGGTRIVVTFPPEASDDESARDQVEPSVK